MNNVELTKRVVLEAHSKQMRNGKNNEEHIIELARVLGGIDAILQQYLSNKATHLTPRQLRYIHDVVTERQRAAVREPYGKKLDKIRKTSDVEDWGKFYLDLDSHDTLLHDMMGDHAQKVIDILYHKCTTFILVVSVIGWCALATPYFKDLLYPIYLSIMCTFLWIPYTVFMLLVMNRQAAKMITRNFEFWLKLWYCIVYCVSTLVDLYGVNIVETFKDFETQLMCIADIIFLAICIPLLCTVIGFWDAFHGKRIWKIGITAFIALEFTIFALYLQYLSYTNDYFRTGTVFTANIGGIKLDIPMLSFRITSLKILSIFFWKHCIWAAIRTEKAISVRKYPYLVWNKLKVVEDDHHIYDAVEIHEQATLDSDLCIPAVDMNNVRIQKPVPLRERQLSDSMHKEMENQMKSILNDDF